MRRTLIISAAAALLVAGAAAFAGVPAKTGGLAKTAAPSARRKR